METKKLTKNEIDEAISFINNGELVSFPTETVYGLGALATNEDAVKKVYIAKGRPSDNPLIVHLANSNDIFKYIASYPDYLKDLMAKFWPGPLTIILPLKENTFSSAVTGGLETCAFRVPDNELAKELISGSGPLVAPSSNTSGKPSPTSAVHVLDDLDGKIAAVLDGGETKVGVESTVIDLSEDGVITILRPGQISLTDLKEVVPNDIIVTFDKHLVKEDEIPKAPGMKYKHYSPETKVIMLKRDENLPEALINFNSLKVGVLANDELLEKIKSKKIAYYSLGSKKDAKEAANHLFAGLRELDKQELDLIIAETIPESDGLGKAYMNRLRKAANGTFFENE